jgi:hypothetical protein
MLNTIIEKYPDCNSSLIKFMNSDDNYMNLYNLLNITLFDTSLRDGLQNIKSNKIKKYTTDNKIKLYNEIIYKYNPDELEIGSIVSEKFFPIFNDTLELFEKLNDKNKNYILVPSLSKLNIILNSNCSNFSFISSVSEFFQLKNTKKTLKQTKSEILEMINIISSYPSIENPKFKIYLSCIDTCPIEGNISNDFIVNEIIYYNKIVESKIICLSDTCGLLNYDNFIDIITKINKAGVSNEIISLHLHNDITNPYFYENLQKIFNYSIDVGIRKFDVSMLDTGGCTITIDNKNTKPNLSYEIYYKLIVDYIISKSKTINI